MGFHNRAEKSEPQPPHDAGRELLDNNNNYVLICRDISLHVKNPVHYSNTTLPVIGISSIQYAIRTVVS